MQDTLIFCKGFQQAAKFDIHSPAKIPKRPGLNIAVIAHAVYGDIPLQPSLPRQPQKFGAASFVFRLFVFTGGDRTVVNYICPTPKIGVERHLPYPAEQWERSGSAVIITGRSRTESKAKRFIRITLPS